MFSEGFFATSALMYMDVATLYFALLPFLLAFSIRYAVVKKYKEHYVSQIAILILTVIIVLIFEVGVRVSGGFLEFSKSSSLPFSFLLTFVIVHVIIAMAAVLGWVYLIMTSLLAFKREGVDSALFQKHKRMGKWIFAALTLTSIMGCMIYLFLFVL
jgi:putative membrane protein